MKKSIIILIVFSLLVFLIGCSTTETENNEPEIVKLMIEQVDESSFYVVTTAEGNELTYAYYVLKDDEVLEKFPYERDAHFSYTAEEPGIYKVRAYIKDREDNRVSEYTEEIEIN